MRTKRTVAGAIGLTIALAMSACSGGSNASKDTAVDTHVNGKGKTLTVWDYEDADSAMGVSWKAAIKQFEKETGAKVKLQKKSFEQVRKTASQVLNSDKAPDVLEYNKGNATAGLLSSQGLLTNLDKAVDKYGWDKKLATSLQTTSRYNSKGVMGSGHWYGVPTYGEYVMAYYNKSMFKKYDIPVPKTSADLVAAMKKFAGHGITPWAESAEEYPLGQLWYQLALSKADRKWVNDFQLYKGKVNWHGKELSYATNTLNKWVKKGYISKNSTGMKAEDAGTAFEAGKYPIFFSGSWWYNRFTTEVKKFKWGSFLYPGTTMSPGSAGNMWVVPTKAKQKDLAYKFIDITLHKKFQNLMGNNGGIPVAADTSAIKDPKSKILINNFNKLTKRDGLGFYPDWPTSTFYDELNAGLQELLNGTKTPGQVNSELGTKYQAGIADAK